MGEGLKKTTPKAPENNFICNRVFFIYKLKQYEKRELCFGVVAIMTVPQKEIIVHEL